MHRITDDDFQQLRKHYTDLQILEIAFSVAGNNVLNRWKEGIGVPQSQEGHSFGSKNEKPLSPEVAKYFKSFLTPTPEKYKDLISKVAPLVSDSKSGQPTRAVQSRRALESRAEVEKALADCRIRAPRLPLVDDAKVQEIVPGLPKGSAPQWVRLLANFPRDGRSRILGLRSAEEKGDLKPILKAQISWIVARQDRAWYALGLAKRRMQEFGLSDDDIYKLDGDWSSFEPAQRALFRVAQNLAASPMVLTDDDVSEALKLTSPREVVQLISYVTNRSFLDKVTEAARLQLDNN